MVRMLKQNQLWPDFSTRELRLELIDEEVEELRVAVANRDMVEIADALTDILYVVYGAGHTFGIDLDDCFDEVHASNMSKLGEDGRAYQARRWKSNERPGFLCPRFREHSKPLRNLWKQYGYTLYSKAVQQSIILKIKLSPLELACIGIIMILGIALPILSIFLYLANVLHLYGI